MAALYLAPLPPRRPSARELLLASISDLPLPPARPAGIAAAPETTGSIPPTPPARPANLMVSAPFAPTGGAKALPAASGADLGQLPKVITAGVEAPPSRALALAEPPPAPKYDPDALLQRAAELEAALPPMPIPAAAPPEDKAVAAPSKRSAWAESVSRLWRLVSFGSFRSAHAKPDSGDLRGAQQ